MENTIFQKGCLIRYNSSIWTGKKKLNPNSLLEGQKEEEEKTDVNFLRAQKFLVDRSNLKPLESIRNDARTYLYSKSLPFPIDGICFVPKDMIPVIDNKMKELQEKFDETVDNFCLNYERFIDEAKIHLGKLFNRSQYPENIGGKFAFEWQYFVLDSPSNSANILSPEVYERERSKFVSTIESFERMAVQTLRETFKDMVSHIVERLGEDKIFKNSTINKFTEFLNDFKALNINEDVDLNSLIEKCKGILTGVNAQDLRDDDIFRKDIKEKMLEVQDIFQNEIVNKPIRKLKLDL